MFTVHWIVCGREAEPIATESFRVSHADILVTSCHFRMEMMRRKHPKTPPDGFIVIDPAGKEIGRWTRSAALP
jgi:hypothetical protein